MNNQNDDSEYNQPISSQIDALNNLQFPSADLELDLKSIKIDEFLQKPLSIGKLTQVIGGMLTMYNY